MPADASNSCRFIGHAGQPVSDILTQTDLSSLLVDESGNSINTTNAKDAPELCLQALKKTLQWAHLAPTAPDTLPCYPLTAGDPFIMPTLNSKENDPASSKDDCNTPHVLFAGNQVCNPPPPPPHPRHISSFSSCTDVLTSSSSSSFCPFAPLQACFASELIQTDKYRTLLVCVPVFRTTGTAVLVNLRTLKASTINFQMGVSEQKQKQGRNSQSDGSMEVEE